jgi:multidrug resistance efflux pump
MIRMQPELFLSTKQQLSRDRFKLQVVLLSIPALLFVLWGSWMFFAHIRVYATTDQARVEVAQTAFIVQAPISGRVLKSHLNLGDQVHRGDALVELESQPQQLQVNEEEAHETALDMQVSNLRQQIALEQSTLASERGAGDAATREARANLAKAEETENFSLKEADQKALLFREGLSAQIDADRAKAEAKKNASELAAAREAVARAQRQGAVLTGERRVRIQTLNKEIEQIEGELATSRSTVERLRIGLGTHQITASGDGRLGEVAALRPGSFVREGDRLAAIIPDGRLRVVANFEPSEAIGRVKVGQKAWLRLDGFPSAEYGPIVANVVGVGNEVRDGRVRVELALQPNTRIPLQHGLPGTLEVEVDHMSPASFLMRQAGVYLAASANAAPSSRPFDPASPQVASR